MKSKRVERISSELYSQLEEAKCILPEELAASIQNAGFECIRCGKCCRGEDNNVAVFPFEVRAIMEKTGQSWLEVVEPPIEGEWDAEGNFHTLEWRLRKDGERCQYYEDDGCQIYPVRPLLCRTYPFYLEEEGLVLSECRGLANEMGPKDALKLATLVKERRLVEIREALELVQRYRDFRRGRPSSKGVCVVHDSKGEHWIDWCRLSGLLDRILVDLE